MIYFTSDLHLCHAKVAEIRGFATTAEHDARIATSWAAVVKPHDQVWVLGDLTGGGHLDEALALIAALPGEKHLILGNHDQAHPMHRDSHRKMARYFPTFTSVQLHARKSIGGLRVMLSHYPYDGDHTDTDRDTQWRLRDCGTPILHGHTHSEFSLTNSTFAGTVQVHVGWDAWFKPVSEAEVYGLLAYAIGEAQP